MKFKERNRKIDVFQDMVLMKVTINLAAANLVLLLIHSYSTNHKKQTNKQQKKHLWEVLKNLEKVRFAH